MTIEIRIDQGKVAKMFKKKNLSFEREVKRQFQIAGLDFIGKIQERWYTGRKGNKGLRVITGRLRSSFLPHTEGSLATGEIKTTIRSDVKYGKAHEEGIPPMPKRTFVVQDFKDPRIGIKLFADAVKIALRKF